MTHEPVMPESAVAWELRGAWAGVREIALSLRGGARVRGYVTHVAPSNAFALVWDGSGELHVPLAVVRAVRRPHFSEPAWGEAVAPPPPRTPIEPPWPGQLELFPAESGR